MTSALRLVKLAAVWLWALCLATSTAQEQGSTDGASAEPSQSRLWAERAEKMALATAQTYQIHVGDLDQPPALLVEKPVLKWSNTYSASVYGSSLVWMHEGRPAAMACFYKFFTGEIKFDAEFHSLATKPIVAVRDEHVVWQPAEAGVEFKPLSASAAPAKSKGSRLVQMRDLAREFSAELTTVLDKTKHRLRLMPQPLVRYESKSLGVIDGALFSFARETDPEVLLLVEAAAPEDGKPAAWQYAIARMHVGALSVRHGDREVWSVPEMSYPYHRQSGPYSLFQKITEPKVED